MPDLIVAGAGPAGLATALYAAQAGLQVVVVDPRVAPTDTSRGHVHEPIDKACGEGLMPGAGRALNALVVELPGAPIRGIRYLDGIDTPRRCSAVTRDEVCAAPNCTRHCVRGRLLRACAPCAARSRRSARTMMSGTQRV
jgi:2-polyprenyl-6-methoxyphenol hydroxylase-like FAD-dependent oxidoreductase